MILVSNAKSVCSNLFGYGKSTFEPLAKGKSSQPKVHHYIITNLNSRLHGSLYNTFGHKDYPNAKRVSPDKISI